MAPSHQLRTQAQPGRKATYQADTGALLVTRQTKGNYGKWRHTQALGKELQTEVTRVSGRESRGCEVGGQPAPWPPPWPPACPRAVGKQTHRQDAVLRTVHFIGSIHSCQKVGRQAGRCTASGQIRALVCGPLLGSAVSPQHGPRPRLACPSTEVVSPSCVDGLPALPTSKTGCLGRPGTEAWPGLFVPWHPRGRLRL